jgi:lipid-A-disaccharide synthase-like uncharacterized protein
MSDLQAVADEVARAALVAFLPADTPPPPVDVSEVGVDLPWLVFGFAAQAVFMARFIVQWIASERAGRSVVPTAFWVISLLGGVSLGIYFLRRGDPVGLAGQSLGIFIYLRNLIFIKRVKASDRDDAVDSAQGSEDAAAVAAKPSA